MHKSNLKIVADLSFANNIEKLIQESQNPLLAKAILFKLQYDSPGWISQTILPLSIGVHQEEIDTILPALEKSNLIRLKKVDPFYTNPNEKFEIWREEEVKKYLDSDIPYGLRTLKEFKELSDEQLLAVMNAISDVVKFRYEKWIELPIDKLRKIRDESHKKLNSLIEQEERKIYRQCKINKNWTYGLPSFVSKCDNTRNDGYDINRFHFYGWFSSSTEAFKNDFSFAEADPPIDNEEKFWRVHMINISRCGEEKNKLILYNSMYGAAAYRSITYQKKLMEFLPTIEKKIEEELNSRFGFP